MNFLFKMLTYPLFMKVLGFIFINPTELEYLQSKFIASTRFIASVSL